jgi:ATP/maltotriose-dependent transcriptional regulator MalT
MTSPVALMLDDVHALRNLECRAALSVLADHVPARSPLALAGWDQPPLRIAAFASRVAFSPCPSRSAALRRICMS